MLQRNGRLSNQDVADKVGLSPSPCLRRTKAIENAGIIRGYTALLNPDAVGQPFQALVEVRLERQNRATSSRFEKHVLEHQQVLECDLIAGDWDYLLRVVAPNIDGFRDFCIEYLARIPGVTNVKSSICLKQIKYSTILPLTR